MAVVARLGSGGWCWLLSVDVDGGFRATFGWRPTLGGSRGWLGIGGARGGDDWR